jgi:hypothetical protein
MNPSDEKENHPNPASVTRSKSVSRIAVILLVVTICGTLLYLTTDRKTDEPYLQQPFETVTKTVTVPQEEPIDATSGSDKDKEEDTVVFATIDGIAGNTENRISTSEEQINGAGHLAAFQETTNTTLPDPTAITADASMDKEDSSCLQPTRQLDRFYKHLDKQPYMAGYELTTSSQKHFTTLVKKLLANPPQVARESDDLYTILKNTAHFFRISGKNNIFMMKGILDHEKENLEQILADYYLLVTTPDCNQTPYASGIDSAALYEYSCFFLNTMGGRLYLFRRDSQSRMVVTYYAILLIDQANRQQNNRHGILLKPSVDMLIAEMESGGSALKRIDLYLDTLYDLKEKYQ